MNATAQHMHGYEITAEGKVYSVLHNWRGYGRRLMVQRPNEDGYPSVRIMIDGKRKRKAVHCLVAEVFLPPRPSMAHEVRHLNGDKTDPRADNLAWGTRKDNADDREAHGRTSRGFRHSLAVRNGLQPREQGSPRDPHKLAKANARLIAAAPDLLEAAQKALNYIANTESELGITLNSGSLLRAAIAKATGAAIMTSLLVTWRIDIDADTPAEAAAQARAIQLDPASLATVFSVQGHDDETITIDVEDEGATS